MQFNQKYALIFIQCCTALAIVAFWILWFSTELLVTSMPESAREHESTFWFADTVIIVPLLLFSARGIFKNHFYGVACGYMASGALFFLVALDATYALQQNLFFSLSLADRLVYAMVVTILLGLASYFTFAITAVYRTTNARAGGK